jgi:hypothetical protein
MYEELVTNKASPFLGHGSTGCKYVIAEYVSQVDILLKFL